MDMAHLVSTWTSCYTPGRAIGAVIVKDKRVMTTGYNGAPSGVKTCGTHAEICYAVHAEQNAIIQAARLGVSIDGATLYCTHQPCSLCTRMIINAGIRRVVYEQGYPDDFSLQLFHDAQIPIEQYDPATGGTTPC